MAVSVEPIPERDAVALTWSIDSDVARRWGAPAAAAVSGYDVWVCLEDLCIPWNTRGRLWTTDHLDLPNQLVAQSVPVTLELRVVVEWADGTRSAAIAAPFVVPPIYDVPPSADFELGRADVLVDNDARLQAGLTYWPDGGVGLATIDGTTYGFASNGPRCSRWRIDPHRFLGEVLARSEPIRAIDHELDYASGSSVWVDPDTGTVLLFFHEEVHPDGDDLRFWSAIGLAVSHDAGATFTSLGRIISPNITIDDPRRVALTEVGGAPFVVHDGMFHIYFRETLASGAVLNMSVARAPVAEVLAEALAGRAIEWRKHRDGAWSEPGLGGAASDLFEPSAATRWFDAIHLADPDIYAMVCSDGMSDTWAYSIRTSDDGVRWTSPERLGEVEVGGELLYLALAAPDPARSKVVVGDTFDLYRTRSASGGGRRWDDAVLERRCVHVVARPR